MPRPASTRRSAHRAGETSPVTSGRFTVRCMCASMSRSRYMLNAAAEPALIDPPRTVARTSQMLGKPPCGEDHHRNGRHEQQLEHARLGQSDVGADRAAERPRSADASHARTADACGSRRHRGVHPLPARPPRPAFRVYGIREPGDSPRRSVSSQTGPARVSEHVGYRHDTIDIETAPARAVTLPSYDVSHIAVGNPASVC